MKKLSKFERWLTIIKRTKKSPTKHTFLLKRNGLLKNQQGTQIRRQKNIEKCLGFNLQDKACSAYGQSTRKISNIQILTKI
jgi:hypothetical protein